MSSYRNLVWRGAFALALLPASAVLVAANGPIPGSEPASMAPQFAVHLHVQAQAQAVAQHQALVRQLKAAQVQELRVAAAMARAAQHQAVAELVAAIRSEQARAERPSS